MNMETTVQLKSLLPALQAKPLTDAIDAEITGCYIGDLLSDVLAHGQPGALWATVQVHRNIISVACTKDIAAILITGGRKPDTEVVVEAEDAGLVLLTTPLTTYEAAGKLWETGLR